MMRWCSIFRASLALHPAVRHRHHCSPVAIVAAAAAARYSFSQCMVTPSHGPKGSDLSFVRSLVGYNERIPNTVCRRTCLALPRSPTSERRRDIRGWGVIYIITIVCRVSARAAGGMSRCLLAVPDALVPATTARLWRRWRTILVIFDLRRRQSRINAPYIIDEVAVHCFSSRQTDRQT